MRKFSVALTLFLVVLLTSQARAHIKLKKMVKTFLILKALSPSKKLAILPLPIPLSLLMKKNMDMEAMPSMHHSMYMPMEEGKKLMLPEFMLPKAKEITLPKLPEIMAPKLKEVMAPKIPEIMLPKFKIPEFMAPKLPEFMLPKIQFKEVMLPKFPEIMLPKLKEITLKKGDKMMMGSGHYGMMGGD